VPFFNPYYLDVPNASLRRGKQAIFLAPKAFRVLQYLVEHAGQLVTKDDLFSAVWPEIAVTDASLAVCLSEIRKALGDAPKKPRYIETVHRLGYRFIAPVSDQPIRSERFRVERPAFPSVPSGPATIMVGRDAEFARVRGLYAEMLAQRRQVLFVAGEAGIGKTTFVRSFLECIDNKENKTRIGRGQCIEQYGSGEPYMPVLEALTRVASDDHRPLELLKKFAPSWVVQLPALFSADERKHLQSETEGVTQQRMLREMALALEALAAETPLVLVLEDLHWSDFSTLELISVIARRSEPARLMVVGTYRPVEMLTGEHRLFSVKAELELHRQCNELRLKLLNEEDVADYLARRFADDESWQSSDRIAPAIYARTEGNPLFMVNVVDCLVEQGSLPDPVKIDAPRTIQQMIENNLQRLAPEEQRALEAASAAGTEFSAAVVAAALERPLREVEDSFMRLSRHQQFVDRAGVATRLDGTVASRFRFHHSLYADVLYCRIAAGHRADLHRRIGECEEAEHGDQASEIAVELAHHYTEAGLIERAIPWWHQAGLRALERSASMEAIGHFAKGLELLKSTPHSSDQIQRAENMRRESQLQLALGWALLPVRGEAAAELEQAFTRAAELYEQLDDPRRLSQSLRGLWAVYFGRGELMRAYELAQQLWQRAQNTNDLLVMWARNALGETLLCMGELSYAREQFEHVIDLYDFEQDSKFAGGLGDTGIPALALSAVGLWGLGYPDHALKRANEAFALAQARSHRYSVLFALGYICSLRCLRREPEAVQDAAEQIILISVEHGLTQHLPAATGYRGWALAQKGNFEEGISHIQQSLAMAHAAGLRLWRLNGLCLSAEVFISADRLDDALSALTEAESAAHQLDAHCWEPAIYRLKGALLQRQSDLNSDEAAICFQRAIEIARRQSAKSDELRATMSLARLLRHGGRRTEARTILAKIYSWFTEGFDAVDLKEAKALLEELAK
jgi:DNA-binding winged helix-turn-helix (wHTH) protein/tetratricopeptide (TPR) repeat protein